jgi:AbrB family looped-hinge helix DNA binding protein
MESTDGWRQFMELARVQARGQVTVPRSVREAAGIRPGDLVAFVVTSPGRVEVRALPRLRLADALSKFKIDAPIRESDQEGWQSEAAKDVLGA